MWVLLIQLSIEYLYLLWLVWLNQKMFSSLSDHTWLAVFSSHIQNSCCDNFPGKFAHMKKCLHEQPPLIIQNKNEKLMYYYNTFEVVTVQMNNNNFSKIISFLLNWNQFIFHSLKVWIFLKFFISWLYIQHYWIDV